MADKIYSVNRPNPGRVNGADRWLARAVCWRFSYFNVCSRKSSLSTLRGFTAVWAALNIFPFQSFSSDTKVLTLSTMDDTKATVVSSEQASNPLMKQWHAHHSTSWHYAIFYTPVDSDFLMIWFLPTFSSTWIVFPSAWTHTRWKNSSNHIIISQKFGKELHWNICVCPSLVLYEKSGWNRGRQWPLLHDH